MTLSLHSVVPYKVYSFSAHRAIWRFLICTEPKPIIMQLVSDRQPPVLRDYGDKQKYLTRKAPISHFDNSSDKI